MNLVSLNNREGTVTLLGNTAVLPVCEFQKTDRLLYVKPIIGSANKTKAISDYELLDCSFDDHHHHEDGQIASCRFKLDMFISVPLKW
jgi:hypothetical protein